MRFRLDTVLTGIAVFAIAGAMLWPHARDAGAVLAAQDDPVSLSDVQIDQALRTDPAVVTRNIDEALKAGDADLANSFVELAAAKNVTLPEDVSKRVADAVTETNSAAQIAGRFATGLVTGNGDDLASMSGTFTGDLFVFGD
ncbi:MAG: hypothetical protein JWQ94_3332, partial [Tardiphaga sp.]|nr:hypothetical protein [Tardiphaga sp.]